MCCPYAPSPSVCSFFCIPCSCFIQIIFYLCTYSLFSPSYFFMLMLVSAFHIRCFLENLSARVRLIDCAFHHMVIWLSYEIPFGLSSPLLAIVRFSSTNSSIFLPWGFVFGCLSVFREPNIKAFNSSTCFHCETPPPCLLSPSPETSAFPSPDFCQKREEQSSGSAPASWTDLRPVFLFLACLHFGFLSYVALPLPEPNRDSAVSDGLLGGFSHGPKFWFY